MAITRCAARRWCKRPPGHDGRCRRKLTKSDVVQMLHDGDLLTNAEKALWKKITGE